MRALFVLLFAFQFLTGYCQPVTFTNPLLPSGADPWAIYHNGYYYYTHTLGNRIALWKTKDLHALKDVTPKTVWEPPAAGPNSVSIWAPELHFLDNKWYIYYTATGKANKGDENRYVFVLENAAADPLDGTWTDKGKVNTGWKGTLDSVSCEYRCWPGMRSPPITALAAVLMERGWPA